jgi:hypothetical protein
VEARPEKAGRKSDVAASDRSPGWLLPPRTPPVLPRDGEFFRFARENRARTSRIANQAAGIRDRRESPGYLEEKGTAHRILPWQR